MTAGEKLARWRHREGLTQEEAAKRAGISQSQWSMLENNMRRRVDVIIVGKVERATGGAVKTVDFTR